MKLNHEKQQPSQVQLGEDCLDEIVWGALADTSRRQILDLLRVQAMTTSELCAHFEFTRFAVMKHLKYLERAKLIIVERRGRERVNHLNPLPIQSIHRRWIKPFEALTADRVLRLKLIAEQTEEIKSE